MEEELRELRHSILMLRVSITLLMLAVSGLGLIIALD